MLKSLKSITDVNPEKPVPTPEDLSAELRSLYDRQIKLSEERESVDREIRAVAREDGALRHSDNRRTQIDSLITGSAYVPAAETRDKMAALCKRRDLLDDAVRSICDLIRVERERAGQLVIHEFLNEQQMLAKEFYRHMVAAIAVHARFGAMKARLESAGVDTTVGPLYDFGRSLLGHPLHHTDHAAGAMRDALRRGYLDRADVPKGYGV